MRLSVSVLMFEGEKLDLRDAATRARAAIGFDHLGLKPKASKGIAFPGGGDCYGDSAVSELS